MSRNSKNARRIAAAREMSKTRLGGGSGPSSTTAKHGKKNAWWQKFRSYSEFMKGGKKAGKQRTEVEADADVVEA